VLEDQGRRDDRPAVPPDFLDGDGDGLEAERADRAQEVRASAAGRSGGEDHRDPRMSEGSHHSGIVHPMAIPGNGRDGSPRGLTGKEEMISNCIVSGEHRTIK
jgi:hypothetical protein